MRGMPSPSRSLMCCDRIRCRRSSPRAVISPARRPAPKSTCSPGWHCSRAGSVREETRIVLMPPIRRPFGMPRSTLVRRQTAPRRTYRFAVPVRVASSAGVNCPAPEAVGLRGLVNRCFIQFFRGQRVDKCLLQLVTLASDTAVSALPLI
jgi:hypothetical protein